MPPSVTDTTEHLQDEARESKRWPHGPDVRDSITAFHLHPETPDESTTQEKQATLKTINSMPCHVNICFVILLFYVLCCVIIIFLFLQIKMISLGQVSSLPLIHMYFPPTPENGQGWQRLQRRGDRWREAPPR